MKKGFTLIEMMIVISIISIIAAIAVPNLLNERVLENEASAISSLRTCVSSQAMFYQGDLDQDDVYDYAESLEELETANLVDPVLGGGKQEGYVFRVESHAPDTWIGTATPFSKLAGKHHYHVDQNGRIYPGVCGNGIVEPGEDCDPASFFTLSICGFGHFCGNDCHCTSINPGNVDEQINPLTGPTSFLAAQSAALTGLDNRSLGLIESLLALSPGATTEPAIELLQSRETVEKILRLLDANGDGKLSFREMTNADVLGIAKDVAADLDVQAVDLDVDEGLVWQLLQSYQQDLRQAILPGMTPDERLPRLPIKGLRSSVNSLQLEMFPPSDTFDVQ